MRVMSIRRLAPLMYCLGAAVLLLGLGSIAFASQRWDGNANVEPLISNTESYSSSLTINEPQEDGNPKSQLPEDKSLNNQGGMKKSPLAKTKTLPGSSRFKITQDPKTGSIVIQGDPVVVDLVQALIQERIKPSKAVDGNAKQARNEPKRVAGDHEKDATTMVVQDAQNGELTVIGPPDEIAEIKIMLEAIEAKRIEAKPELDDKEVEQPGVTIFALNNRKASEVSVLLERIYEAKYQEKLGPVKIIVKDSLNSILVVGPKQGIENIERLIELLDAAKKEVGTEVGTEDGTEKAFELVNLQHRKSAKVRELLVNYFSDNFGPKVSKEFLCLSNDENNSLVVRGTKEELAAVKEIVKLLDVSSKQGAKRDVAQFTYVVALVTKKTGGEPQVWLQDLMRGKRKKLSVGDSFEIGNVNGRVTRITSEAFEYLSGEKIHTVLLGGALR